MRCGKTHLIEIRNFEDFSIEPAGNMTFLTGKNGAGKTNIIEAIYFASVGKSFRTSNDEELIRLDKEEGTILLDFTVRGVTHEIKIKLSRNKGKKILINETATKKKILWACFVPCFLRRMSSSLLRGRRRIAVVLLIWRFPRSVRGTMKKYSVMAGRYSSGMQHLKKLVFMDLWWMWIYGICRLPKEHRIS